MTDNERYFLKESLRDIIYAWRSSGDADFWIEVAFNEWRERYGEDEVFSSVERPGTQSLIQQLKRRVRELEAELTIRRLGARD